MDKDPPTPSSALKGLATKTTSWPIDFSAVRSPPAWLANTATTIIFLFAVALFFLALVAIIRLAIDLLGDNPQRASEAIKSLLPIAAAAVGLPLIIWRLVILNQQTRISEIKTQIDRETHYTSIFSKSIDQLGQTREVNETREREHRLETTTRTVPNIEVRLGGIHSLTRLGEESIRDREKIENTLRSYVRENSWSDRRGFSSSAPAKSSPRFHALYAWSRSEEPDRDKALEVWESEVTEYTQNQLKWGASLSETRVDVNEAIDAIVKLRRLSQSTPPDRLYECLFVGRSFSSELLNATGFERCTFANCFLNLKENSDLRFSNCQFLNSRFSGNTASIFFVRSILMSCGFEDLNDCSVSLRASTAYNLGFSASGAISFSLPGSTLIGGWLAAPMPITLDARSATIFQFDFNGISFSAAAQFERCTLVKADFRGADLSQVEKISPQALASMRVNARTVHPKTTGRPESWPEYDPNYEDPDEIPF
jgi:uncharacterized protein YjbI with pentapeptide repeats